MFGKDYSDGAWGGSYIEEKEGRLAENEKYEITIRAGIAILCLLMEKKLLIFGLKILWVDVIK
jgi:hypothetical protein